MKLENIQWVIFDAMGVTFKVGDDINDLLIPYLQKLNPELSPGKVHELYALASIGKISSRQVWRELGFEKEYPGIEKTYLDDCLEVDPGFYPCAGALRPRYRLAMLSNDVKEWSQYLREKNKLDGLLEVAVISGDVGFRKPDPRIYQELLRRISADPSRCLFMDDRVKNLAPARELDFKTLLFLRTPGGETDGHPVVRSFSEITGLLSREEFQK